MGACDKCCTKEDQSDVFKPYSQRGCTDLLFTLLFICAWVGSIALAVVSINKDPNLLTNIYYPTDSYGNNCGKPGSVTADKKFLVYPSLDTDIQSPTNAGYLATGQYWRFDPTRICVDACPGAFSLNNLQHYGGTQGGVAYPCNGDAACEEGFTYVFETQNVVGRCAPLGASAPANTRDLCVSPKCQEASLITLNGTTLGGTVHCASVPSQPDGHGAWEMCDPSNPLTAPGSSLCINQKDACDVALTEETTEGFAPEAQTTTSKQITAKFATWMQTVLGAVDSLIDPYGIGAQLGFGIGFPIVAGFAWAVLLWFFAGVIVYLLIVLLIAALIMLDTFCAYKAGWFDAAGIDTSLVTSLYNSSITTASTGTEQTWFTIFACIFIIVTVIIIVLVFAWRQCIKRLIAILKECTKVFKAMWLIVVWPIFCTVATLGVFAFGLILTYFISYVWNDIWQQCLALIFHLLVIFWSVQLIRACTWTSMAAAISKWFCTENAGAGSGKCCGFGAGGKALCDGTWLIMSKHLGSMCFGALIIAVVQVIRTIVAYLDYYTQNAQKGNMLLRVGMKCLQCCLACLQKTIEFVSYYGFVFVAMRGDNFCKACYNTFSFVMAYPAQTAVNKTIQKLLKLLIGLSTPVLAAVFCFYFLDSCDGGRYKREYNTLWASGVTFLIAYLVTDGICMVYDVSIDTIYLCAFKDMKENPPSGKFISNELRDGFGLDKADHEASKIGKHDGAMARSQKKEAAVEVSST